MSRIGLGLCVVGGTLIIIFWFYFCILEALFLGQLGVTKFCTVYVYSLIVGTFGIIGAIFGWKIKKEGYLLSIIVGCFMFTFYLIFNMIEFGLNFYMIFKTMFFTQAVFASLGAIFIFVGGIYGYIKS